MATAKPAGKPGSKLLSRPVIYTLVGAVAVYAYVLNTQPDAPTHHKTYRVTKSKAAAVDSNGFTDADLNAHFARYAGKNKDPFVPAIDLHPGQNAPGVPSGGTGGQWSLTGVNTVDGVTTATVENPGSGDSVFLKAGDRWNGLRVLAVNSDSVLFENALGQKTRLAFPGNDLPDGTAIGSTVPSTASGNGPTAAPALPGFSLRPMPVPGPAADPNAAAPADQSTDNNFGSGRGRGRRGRFGGDNGGPPPENGGDQNNGGE